MNENVNCAKTLEFVHGLSRSRSLPKDEVVLGKDGDLENPTHNRWINWRK